MAFCRQSYPRLDPAAVQVLRLARINGTYELNWDLQSVAAIITTIVPLVVFLIFQRQFAAGAETRSGAKD